MTPNYPPIPLHYIVQIKHYLAEQGIDAKTWLAQVKLSEQDVIEDQVMLTYQDYEKLILSAIKLTQREDLGLMIGSRLSINTHGVLGFALLNCTSIRAVLGLIDRYVATRTPLLKVTILETAGEIVISLQESYNIELIRRCFFDVMMVSIQNVLHAVLPSSTLLKRVELPYGAPDYREVYSQILKCEVCFDQLQARAILGKDSIDLPLVHADEHSLHQARMLCEKELQRVVSGVTYAEKVTHLLLNSREHFLNLQQVSAALHMTPRTLHRRLALESSNYKVLLEQVRAQLAQRYLKDGQQSIKQVAYNLGYSDVANFRRAFKRWYGASPQDIRNKHWPKGPERDYDSGK